MGLCSLALLWVSPTWYWDVGIGFACPGSQKPGLFLWVLRALLWNLSLARTSPEAGLVSWLRGKNTFPAGCECSSRVFKAVPVCEKIPERPFWQFWLQNSSFGALSPKGRTCRDAGGCWKGLAWDGLVQGVIQIGRDTWMSPLSLPAHSRSSLAGGSGPCAAEFFFLFNFSFASCFWCLKV